MSRLNHKIGYILDDSIGCVDIAKFLMVYLLNFGFGTSPNPLEWWDDRWQLGLSR